MADTKKYPWQQTILNNLRGECWEDIPGLDGYYSISNKGRIKRDAFEILCKNGTTRRMNPRIMVPEIITHKNQTVGDTNFFLRIKITRGGIGYEYSVPRLLYSLFVKNFDLLDYSLVVIARDGNGKNLLLKNLTLVNIARKQQRIYERNRLKRTFYYTYDEYLETSSETSVNPFCKQVSQYSLKGKRIKTFPSIKAAALTLNIPETGILNVLKKRQISSFGFVWDYGKKLKVDVKAIRHSNLEHYKKLRGQKVTQYSVKGKRIATYSCIADAWRNTGVNNGDISSVLSGKQQTAGGFIWRRGWGKAVIDVKGFIYGEVLRAQRRQKKVKQYTASGKYLQTFESVKEAAAVVGCSRSSISAALGKNDGMAKNFIWKLAR